MAFLALEHPEQLTRADFARLAYATGPGDRQVLPFSERYLQHFEEAHCYDRCFDEARSGGGLNTQVMCCDHAFLMVGDSAGSPILQTIGFALIYLYSRSGRVGGK